MLKVELIGNLGADAEVKSSNGNSFVALRIAHTEKWTDGNDTKQERTIWVDATMNDTESKVIPYLRQGVKVFIRGNASLRLYSSPKDKCMKAGLSISVREIELVGGQSDEVPRRLIDPANAMLFDVSKHYWINRDNSAMANEDVYTMVDDKGRQYVMNKAGFVFPAADPNGEQQNQEQAQVDDTPVY